MFAVLDDVHRTCATTSGAFFYRSFGSAVPRLMNRCLGFRLNAASSRRRQFGRRSYVLDMPEIEGFGGCYRRKGQTNQNDYSTSALKQPGPASSIIRWRSTMGVLTATRGHEKEGRSGGAASSRVFKRPARPAFITPHPYGHPQHEQAAEAARSTQHAAHAGGFPCHRARPGGLSPVSSTGSSNPSPRHCAAGKVAGGPVGSRRLSQIPAAASLHSGETWMLVRLI